MFVLDINEDIMLILLVISIVFLIICLLEDKIKQKGKKNNLKTFNCSIFDEEDINNMF